MTAGAAFTSTRADRVGWIEVAGPIGDSDAARLEAEISASARDRANAVIVDIREIGYISSAAVHALIRGRRRLAREGKELLILCRVGPVRRTLHLVGAGALRMYETREEALAAVPS